LPFKFNLPRYTAVDSSTGKAGNITITNDKGRMTPEVGLCRLNQVDP
jgi:hypothetical protein